MADICFICSNLLSNSKNVVVERGLQTLKNASVNRGDGHIELLQNVNEVTIHVNCRKNYIRKSSIIAFKRSLDEEIPETPQSSRKMRLNSFEFQKLCLFCGEEANEQAQIKKEKKFRRIIRKVCTLSFKDNIIKLADARGDRYGRTIKDRVNFVPDLVAVGAKYHNTCFVSFTESSKQKGHNSVGRPLNVDIISAMEEIFNYIENHEDCQFTLGELKEVVVDYVPDNDTIISKLIERYGENIVITTKPKSMTIICFRNAQANILNEAWYKNKKLNPTEERLRIIETAATFIREDIRSVAINNEFYPPANQMFQNINEDIPSLLFFVKEIILKNKKVKTEHLQTKCTAISHAIMAAVRPRSFSSHLLLGLSVFLHRRYGSRRLLDILSAFGFAAPYKDATMYEAATVYNPQPCILSPESGALVQYSADNADINVNTIDGHNTLHIMGIIKMVTPISAVIANDPIIKYKKTPPAKDLAAVAHVPLKLYENYGVSGMSRIEVKKVAYVDDSSELIVNKVDLLWMYGKWKVIPGFPGWNGFLEYLTKNNTKFSTSAIMFLPFIHHPASNYDTIFTTLNCALENARLHGHEVCIVTFDQPLYMKAREIVAASEIGSQFSKIIVRLGGFHLLMSFLGSIGYIMAGSGIKEALSVVYAPNSVDKMLNGHAYARAVRGHTLLHLALSSIIFEEMQIDNITDDFLKSFINDVMGCIASYDDIEESRGIFEPLVMKFSNKLKELQERGPTAQLWVQYLHMVSISKDFIRAERLGNWNGHLQAIQKMLPYFHAAGHFLYAKSAHLYLQDMLALENNVDQQTFQKLSEGFFTIRRSNKFNCGTWSDMVIEQTLMKSMKTEGGVARGRSTQESVLSKWIYGMHATNTVCEEIERFCNVSLDTSDQHVDSRDSRTKRDNADVKKLIEWFSHYNPYPTTSQIMSIVTGVTGNDKINCHNAYNVGFLSMNNMVGQTFDKITFKRSNRVLSLLSVNNSVKVHDCKVAIDPLLLFQRISLYKKFDEHLCEYLQYELSPYPQALFSDIGMRKTTKSLLYKCFEPTNVELDHDNTTYIIDGGFLLHRVIWQKDDTFYGVINRYVDYLYKHFGSNIVVVFDGYNDNSKNVKAMEQLRRIATTSGSIEVLFDETMQISISQEKFLSNRSNKNRLISMLMDKFASVNINTKQAQDDADVLIIETAFENSIKNSTAVVGEDIDILVLLMARNLPDKEIYFVKPGKGKVQTKIYSSATIGNYTFSREHLLFLHAITGCDTTSALFNKGKIKIMKLFEKNLELHNLAAVFQQENCPHNVIVNNGTRFLLTIYGAPNSESSLDNYRYLTFAKSTRYKASPVNFSSLPPTAAAAQQHLYRVYYQVQTWLGKELNPEQWGWEMRNNLLEPIRTLLPPAPDELLKTIFCNCTKGCGKNCGCRKVGLQCSVVCGHCRGQSCLNCTNLSFDDSEEIHLTDDEINAIDILIAEKGDNEIDIAIVEDEDEEEL